MAKDKNRKACVNCKWFSKYCFPEREGYNLAIYHCHEFTYDDEQSVKPQEAAE